MNVAVLGASSNPDRYSYKAVRQDGEPVEGATPVAAETRPSFLARGRHRITVEAPGHAPAELEARHVWDEECATNALFGGVLGAVLFLPAVLLLGLPWCSAFEQAEYHVTLAPDAGAP